LAFSLRTLLALVALLCAWLAWERHVVEQRKAALADWAAMRVVIAPSSADQPSRPQSVSWIRGRLGDGAVATISVSTEHEPIDLERARRLFPEARVQWAAILKRRSMVEIIPLPSRDHGVLFLPGRRVVVPPP
jgi:hypothetical protein